MEKVHPLQQTLCHLVDTFHLLLTSVCIHGDVNLVPAASHSQKGSHRDRREVVVYDDEEGLFD